MAFPSSARPASRALGVPGARSPPVSGTLFVGFLAATSFFAIGTGVLDILLPALRGEESFTFLWYAANELGPVYLFLHIFLHNLGIAALVPGVGLLAAGFERNPRQRRWIAPILAGAVILSLAVATELVIRRGYWRTDVVLPLLLLEAGAVLLATWAGWRQLRGFVPTRRPGWSWVKPARELAPWMLASAILLGVAAFAETAWIHGILA